MLLHCCITVAANTFTNIAGNANTDVAENTTKIRTLGDRINIGRWSDVDLTNWDVSHANSTRRAFSNANVFNQDISSWDVGNVTDMQYVKGIGINKQPSHVSHLANIPTANILVKGICVRKHILHISHIANIPTANILVKDICVRKCWWYIC
jgi:surface protein